MVRDCSNCGVQGSFLEIKKRNLPMSPPVILCKNCFNKIYQEQFQRLQIINSRKDRILRKMYESIVKRFCREKGIPISEKKWTVAKSRRGTRYKRYYTYYYSYEELIQLLHLNSTLDEIIEFAKRNKVPIKEIITEIESEQTQIEFQNKTFSNEMLKSISNEIVNFKPLLPNYKFELPYHIDLARHLMQKFKNAKVEVQKSSARPDIVIDNIAIEVKGPTNEKSLQTLADKCIRYSQYFDKNLIFVLFDLQTTDRFYLDWERGIKQNFPKVTIIKKW